ncbi:MAG: hypothetical protein QXK20_03340, partial [Nitrososphaerales archaeon]
DLLRIQIYNPLLKNDIKPYDIRTVLSVEQTNLKIYCIPLEMPEVLGEKNRRTGSSFSPSTLFYF